MQIGDLEPADRLVPAGGRRVGTGDVATARSAHALVPARAERVRALAGQNHDADVEILAGARERIRHLDHGLRTERVAHLGPVDRDLRDAGVLASSDFVPDVFVVAGRFPCRWHAGETTVSGMSSWVTAAAARRPDRVAVESPERSLSYEQLRHAVIGAAAELQARGVGLGSRVALALPAGVDFLIAFHGCLVAGAVAIPIDLRLNEAERARRMAGAEVVVSEPLAQNPLNMPVASSGDPPVAVMHTSGTTAAPKQVLLTQVNFLASALGSAVALGLDQDERWLCPMPLTHVGGLSIPIRSAIYGTTTVVLHGRFDTEAVLPELMDPARRITLVSLVPTMLARLLDAGLERPPTLRWALLGGGRSRPRCSSGPRRRASRWRRPTA